MQLEQRSFDEEIEGVADHLLVEGEGLVGFLIEEMGAVAVAVEIRGGDDLQVWFLEFFARFEGLVEDGAGEQVAHLEADEGLASTRGGRADVEFEIRFALDVNCVD